MQDQQVAADLTAGDLKTCPFVENRIFVFTLLTGRLHHIQFFQVTGQSRLCRLKSKFYQSFSQVFLTGDIHSTHQIENRLLTLFLISIHKLCIFIH